MKNEKEHVDWSFLKILPPKNSHIIVFDTETTGLNYKYDHILELGAVEIENGKLTGKQFHIYIEPRKKISQNVIAISAGAHHTLGLMKDGTVEETGTYDELMNKRGEFYRLWNAM